MEDYNDTLEELEAKIREYESHLVLVRNEIKKFEENEDPVTSNEKKKLNDQVANLKKLESDMLEVISLTKDLINYKKQNEKKSNERIDIKPLDDHKEIKEVAYAERPEVLNLIGRTCSFMHENKRLYAIIENVEDQKGMEQVVVSVIGSDERIVVMKNLIQLNEVLDSSVLLDKTNQFQALYKKDGKWYDCIISKSKEECFLITYIGYNTSEYVKNDQVRIKKKKKVKEITTPAGYKIPENLIIKENDSAKVKMQKKKKRITLKKIQKNEIIDKVCTNKAQQWRSFHEKALSKSKYLLTAHNKKAQEMNGETKNTSAFNIRRKFDYNDNEE